MNLRYEIEDTIDVAPIHLVGGVIEGEERSYPWPSERKRTELTGELAERVRRALGEDPGTSVYIEEVKEYGGYSEYTQEHSYEHTLMCGFSEKEFRGSDGRYSSLTDLLAWLDENAP